MRHGAVRLKLRVLADGATRLAESMGHPSSELDNIPMARWASSTFFISIDFLLFD